MPDMVGIAHPTVTSFTVARIRTPKIAPCRRTKQKAPPNLAGLFYSTAAENGYSVTASVLASGAGSSTFMLSFMRPLSSTSSTFTRTT